MTTRLLIVEDDPEIASALTRGLMLHGYEADAELRADRAFDRLVAQDYAGAIVDVMLGVDSGLDLVRRLRDAGLDLPILMLSALTDVEDRARGLEAGADDYVIKPFSLDELVARLKVQERRSAALRPQVAQLDMATRTLSHGQTQITLTEREALLLAFLIDHPDSPQPRGQIFDALWAGDGSTSENVVDVYIGYLRKKLNGFDTGFEIKTIRHQGFVLKGRRPLKR